MYEVTFTSNITRKTATVPFTNFNEALRFAMVMGMNSCQIDIIATLTGEVLVSVDDRGVPYVSTAVAVTM